ncbi:MAG: hypothetical protein OXM02_06865 [Bacteroidota bacterium]|nr:hypothetical protein [Bacteroidota bacterium]
MAESIAPPPARSDRTLNRLAAVESEVQKLGADVKVLQADVKDLQTDVKDLQTDVKDLQTDVKDLQADVKVLRTEIQHIREIIGAHFDGFGKQLGLVKWFLGIGFSGLVATLVLILRALLAL